MHSTIIRLRSFHRTLIETMLLQEEPWHIIASDSFMRYGLSHPEHQWYGEMINGRLKGIIYIHRQLIHLIYPHPPGQNSAVYAFIQQRFHQFITHGKKEIVQRLIHGLSAFHYRLMDHADFVEQSDRTLKIVKAAKTNSDLIIRTAKVKDYSSILRLYQGSSINQLVDPVLIHELIQKGRVTIAEKKRHADPGVSSVLLGTIMTLKESPNYALLGGLYVSKKARHRGIASMLGKKAILDCEAKNKKVCFYYSNQNLLELYKKISIRSLGRWVTYMATSKAMT